MSWLSDIFTPRDTVGLTVVRRTGHEFPVDELHGELSKWLASPDEAEIRSNSLFKLFSDAVVAHSELFVDDLTLYRGRYVTHFPTSDEMGPPPDKVPPFKPDSGGRYDGPADAFLYLSDCENGCLREHLRWEKPGIPYLQRYRLPSGSLRIADFTKLPIEHLLSRVFEKAENCKYDSKKERKKELDKNPKFQSPFPDNYLFSQVVGSVVKDHFDGMRVVGVGGLKTGTYTNVIVFKPNDPFDRWKGCLDPSSQPYVMNVPELPHDDIAVAAFYLWQAEGEPHGRDLGHWYEAIDQLKELVYAP